jgi:hypothetical protein
MRKLNVLILGSVIIGLISCSDLKKENKSNLNASFSDAQVYSSSNVAYEEEESEIDYNLKKEFLDLVFDQLMQRKDVAFYDSNSMEEKKLSAEDVEEKLRTIVLVHKEDPKSPGEFIQEMDTVLVKKEDIIAVLTREEWAFDKDKLQLSKKVNYLGPVIRTYDEQGYVRGKMILFWIKLNN